MKILNKKLKTSKNKIMKKNFFCLLFCFFTGFVCGFFGTGGGLILLPYMIFFLNKNEIEARATTILYIFCLVLVCSFFYLKKSAIDWKIAQNCVIGGIIGGFIGTRILNNIEKKWLRIFFIIFLVYSGVKMII